MILYPNPRHDHRRHWDEGAQSRLRSSLRRPGPPASCSRYERLPDTRYSCAAFSTVESPTSSPPLPWPLLSACCGSDANIRSGIRDRSAPHRTLRRLHQQHSQEGVPLLADRSQSLMSTRTVLPRNQPQITGHLLTPRKTRDLSHRQHKGHRGDRSHSGRVAHPFAKLRKGGAGYRTLRS
jgi:hypothetical protein